MSRRLAAVALAVALVVTGCAVGKPKPTTDETEVSATLNGDVYSSFDGDTTYWWKYGETTSYDTETPHGTIAIADDQPHPVSEPITGLSAGTTYHFQMCVEDEEEDPPRTICSSDNTFTTDGPDDGSEIAFTSDRDGDDDIWAMGSGGGTPSNLTDTSSQFESGAAWSPDGSQIAYERSGEIFVMDADGDNQTNITGNIAFDYGPTWSSGIAFTSNRDDGVNQIYIDGTGNISNNFELGYQDSEPAWSPDGTKIAFTSDRDDGFTHDIFVMGAAGNDPINLTQNLDAGDGQAAWSPDGSKIAFTSFRDGNWEVYVMDADGSDQTNLTNNPVEDVQPTWSPDGSKIAFATLRDSSGDTHEVYVMDADGSDQTNLTNSDDSDDGDPAWSPAP